MSRKWMLLLSLLAALPRSPGGLGDEVLRSEKIHAAAQGAEFHVTLQARAPNSSWEIEGRECALLRVLVDGRYDQHLFLLGGPEAREYEFLIGPLSAGDHLLRLEWDRSWTPALQDPPELMSLSFHGLDPRDPAQEPLLRAPIIYLRKDTIGKFSDVPLLLYWDIENPQSSQAVTYTLILSNEDGGTNTPRLMARWGRTTDIEWCYAYAPSGDSLQETYQARDHKTLPFRGRKEGLHPVLYDATRNNNFADTPEDASEVRVRLFPLCAGLNGRARETIMDRFPWTYAVMAGEMKREKKIRDALHPAEGQIADLRDHAYLEICSIQRGTELYFELQVRGSSRWFRSDRGDTKARIERDGCARSAIELPRGTRPEALRALRIQCRAAPPAEGEKPVPSPRAELLAVRRLFLLDRDFHPGRNLMEREIASSLKPGQSLTLRLTR